MPRKRQSDAGAQTADTDTIRLSQGDFSMLLQTMQRSQMEFCTQLLDQIRSSTPASQTQPILTRQTLLLPTVLISRETLPGVQHAIQDLQTKA